MLQPCRSGLICWADVLLLASSVCGLFKWRQFEPEVILLAVGWYLRFSLSYRDVEELLAERGLRTDHVTVWRWVQRYGLWGSRNSCPSTFHFPLVPNPNVLARMASQLLADLDGERLHGPSPNLAAISLHSGKDHALENLVAVDILRPFHHSTTPPLLHR